MEYIYYHLLKLLKVDLLVKITLGIVIFLFLFFMIREGIIYFLDEEYFTSLVESGIMKLLMIPLLIIIGISLDCYFNIKRIEKIKNRYSPK